MPLRQGGEERRAARGGHGLRRHGPLDDEKIGAPVPERQHEAQPHRHAEPLDAHRIGARRVEVAPGVGPGARLVSGVDRHRLEHRGEAAPSSDVLESEEHQGEEAQDDQEELEDLVVDRRGQPAEEDVDQDDDGGDHDAEVEVPAEHQLEELREGIHRDPRRQDRHRGERDRVEAPGLLVESEPEILRHRARSRAVVERHHEDADEHHRRDRAHPVEVARHHAVLGARGRHAITSWAPR